MARLTITTSNLNLPRRWADFGGLTTHEDFLEATGYSDYTTTYIGGNFEWSETRNPRNLALPRLALQLAARGRISSLRQSWRSTRIPEIAARILHPSDTWNNQPNTPKNIAAALGRAIVIPFIDSWDARLLPIQTAAGKRLPVVVYPNEQQPPGQPPRFHFDYPTMAQKFAALRYQPTAETLQAWGVLSEDVPTMVDDLLAVQGQYGLGGIAWNTKHSPETRHGLQIPSSLDMLGLLATRGALDAIELNLSGDPDSLRQVLDGNLADTHHGTMLARAFGGLTSHDAITVVTNLPADDIQGIGISDITATHRVLVQSIAAMM